MRRSNTRWFAALGTCLALGLTGCGGGEPADEGGDQASADPPPPAAGEMPPPAAGADMAPPPVVAANPGRGANAPAEAAPAVAAPAARPLGAATNANATDELLQLSQAGAAPAPAAPGAPGVPGAEVAAGAEGPGLDPAGANPDPAGYASPAGGRFGVGVGNNNDAAEAMRLANGAGFPGAGGYPAPGQEGAIPGSEGAAIPGGPDLGLGGGGADSKAPSFIDPVHGANSFLDALHAKDPERIAQAVALRAPTEAAGKHQALFQSLLLKSTTTEELDELASHFDKMKVVSVNPPKVIGLVGVTVGRQEESGNVLTVTLEMRKEKAGWKVQDYKQPIQRVAPGRSRRPGTKGR